MFLELILLLSILSYFFYKWATKNYHIFEERGVPYNKPLPLIGNAWDMIKNRQNLHKTFLNLYKKEKQHKVFGRFQFRDPVFIIHDPEIIKKIMVKDFDSFVNHQKLAIADSDPLLRGMLTVMKDQRWRNMRNTLTPIFTSSKMRAMYALMNECFAESLQYLHKKFDNGKKVIEIEMKDCFNRLSNDIIATTAFGLKVNSYENANNEFYTIGKHILNLGGTVALKFMLMSLLPQLFKWFNIKMFDEKHTSYFVKLVVDTMKYRQEHNIVRPDMIQLLMEAKKESEYEWTEEEIVAQCFIFFFAAFENNALLLCTTCFELAKNPDIQQKLYEEIADINEQLNGKSLDYDALQKMKYLDMVLQESLRRWSLAAILDRDCNKDYTITDEDGKVICEIRAGEKIFFNAVGLHADERYFEQPEVFDPERFSDENKNNIHPFTYLPFGAGPRSCIGNRYALMQAKAMIFILLREFQLEKSEKTPTDLYEVCSGFSITPKTGFWFKLSKRVPTTNL